MSITTYQLNGKKLYEVYVNGVDSLGRRVQRRKRGIESIRKAQDLEFEFDRELAKLKEEAVPYRWSEWYAKCLAQMKLEYRASTLENYEKQIPKWVCPVWDNLEIRNITKSDVHSLIYEKVDAKITPWTRKTILKMVKRIFEMAVEDGVISRNPCNGVQVKVAEVEQKVLTNSEVGIFLREAKLANHRFYPMWALALMTGMRSGELFALKFTDVDLEGRIISVTKQWSNKSGFGPTKTQKNRVVPISDELLKFLKEMKLQRGAESEFVLPQIPEWENGEQARITREFCETIGITVVKFHDLRATFITNLLARGVSLAQVMAIVGHTQIKTTNGYLRKAGVDLHGATEKLGYKLPTESPGQLLSLVK